MPACPGRGHFVVEPVNLDRLVEDTGCGMDPETTQRIFDPLFNTNFAGLELAAVPGSVRGHGGALRVSSEPGHGTTFTVLLPCGGAAAHPSHAPPAGPSETAANPLAGLTILTVDDDESARDAAVAMLSVHAAEVLSASDGREGPDLFRSHRDRVSLALLDLTVPRTNSSKVCRELHRLRPGVPVLLTSGYTQQQNATRTADRGFAGFIQKPSRAASLAGRIREPLTPDGGAP